MITNKDTRITCMQYICIYGWLGAGWGEFASVLALASHSQTQPRSRAQDPRVIHAYVRSRLGLGLRRFYRYVDADVVDTGYKRLSTKY